MRILIVEDELHLAEALTHILRKNNYTVDAVSDGASGQDYALSGIYDLILLDIMLPEMDGITVLKNIRKENISTPVILLTAKGEISDKVNGLDSGADDYLAKPFATEELLARIRVMLRHAAKSPDTVREKYKVGDLEIDLEKHLVALDGAEVHFTPMEFKILALLVKNSGKVLTHSYILKKVWGSYLESDAQSLRVFMANIRRKLEKDPTNPRYIITEVGIGYRFADE
jgi:two-component system KDP operon response regulator KdpE